MSVVASAKVEGPTPWVARKGAKASPKLSKFYSKKDKHRVNRTEGSVTAVAQGAMAAKLSFGTFSGPKDLREGERRN